MSTDTMRAEADARLASCPLCGDDLGIHEWIESPRHQTAFIAVTMLGSLSGRLPGLQTAPSSLAWVAERLAWLPAFAVGLLGLWAVFRRAEQPRRARSARA